MKRPADQAKLLLLYLLRSSAAALANSSNNHNNAAAAGHICLRLARRTDVSSIQRCNLATLPENYNAQFYTQHMRQWPDLALVAEHVLPEHQQQNQNQNQNHRTTFPRLQPEPKIVGYVLGKVEDRAEPYDAKNDGSSSTARTYLDLAGNPYKLQPTGHVTSLAVLSEYRRMGLAASLLDQLHAHLQAAHGVDAVGLHVRQGNAAATSLYRRFGYTVHDVLDHYYADGEPAFLMRKPLMQQMQTTANNNNNNNNSILATDHTPAIRFGGGSQRSTKPWKSNGPFGLPRIVWTPPPNEKDDASATVVMEEEDVQVMTGT